MTDALWGRRLKAAPLKTQIRLGDAQFFCGEVLRVVFRIKFSKWVQ